MSRRARLAWVQLWLLRWWTWGQNLLFRVNPKFWSPLDVHLEAGPLAYSTAIFGELHANGGGPVAVTIPGGSWVFVIATYNINNFQVTVGSTTLTQLQYTARAYNAAVYVFNPASAQVSVTLGWPGQGFAYCEYVIVVYTGVLAIGATVSDTVGMSMTGGQTYSNSLTTTNGNSWVLAWTNSYYTDANPNGYISLFTGSPVSMTSRGNQESTTVFQQIWGSDTNGPVVANGAVETATVTANGGSNTSVFYFLGLLEIQQLSPVVAPTVTPSSGKTNTSFAFTANASSGDPPYTYAWTFGDGKTSTLQNPDHTYTTKGTYQAALTVTDSTLLTASGGPPSLIVSQGSNSTGGTLGNNTIGRHRAPKLSTTDRIETTDNYGGT